jgi:hypothetical protein
MDRRIVVPDGTIELSEWWGPIIRYHPDFGGERVRDFLRTVASVKLPRSVRTIRIRAFREFLRLKSITVDAATIGPSAFQVNFHCV